MLVIDEAYIDYLAPEHQPNTISMLSKYPNLILTRTFSKAYGLAGLRLGYAIAHPSISRILKKVIQPFTINMAALVAAEAALSDMPFLRETYKFNQQGREKVLAELTKLNLKTLPCFGNFVTVDMGKNSLPIYQKLLQQGIIVRPLHAYGLPNYLRITIGTPEQNALWVSKMTED